MFIYCPKSHNLLKLLSVLYCIYIFTRFHGYSKSVCNNYFSSPIWGSKELKYWEFFIFTVFIAYPDIYVFLLGAVVAVPTIQYMFNGGYGSMYCAIANIWALWYLYKY